MDIEKTLQAIMESHRRAAERADRADERADRADARMDTFDKQLRATAKLVRAGILLVQNDRKAQKAVDAQFNVRLNALIQSHSLAEERSRKIEEQMRRTDEKFERWLDELRRKRTNGHR